MMRRTLILFASVLFLITGTPVGSFAQDSRTEYGKCGYYADALHGRKTASGERYDKTLLTCAHKTLPFGTNIRVTRLDNSKSVEVRVNDRGPYIDGYIVDLSRKAAETIGLIRDGVTKVKVEIVPATTTTTSATPVSYSTTASTSTQKSLPANLETGSPAATTSKVYSASEAKVQLVKPQQAKTSLAPGVKPVQYQTLTDTKPDPEPAPVANTNQVSELYQIQLNPVQGQGYGLQLAVLTNTENLFQQVAKLQATWPGRVVLNHEEANGFATYKLILGPYATRNEALAQQKTASAKGFKKSFVVTFQ